MTADDRSKNADVAERYARALFPSVATLYSEPFAIESAEGSRVRDFDGRTYLDFFGGILTVGLGHAHPGVNGAAKAQMDRLGHVSTLYPNLAIVELAEKLVALAPGAIAKAFFCTSGTEANETAVGLAQAFTGRLDVVGFRHGYAGRSLVTQSIGGNAAYRPVPTQLAGVRHAFAPYCYRCPFGATYPSCELRCARDVEDMIRTTTPGQVAGVVVEPIMGVGGVIVPPEGWMRLVVEIVRRHGGVFICDEVQTGFGRTGAMWGVDHEGLEPDVMTMAKGIANGFPISAVLATAPIADAWKAGNVSTFGGNPVSCAAGSATIDALAGEDLPARAASLGRRLREGLDALKRRHRIIGDVRGRGLMQGLEIVRDEAAGDRTPDASSTSRVLEEARRRGLLVGRGGSFSNVIRVAPALVVGARDVDDALAVLDESLAAATA